VNFELNLDPERIEGRYYTLTDDVLLCIPCSNGTERLQLMSIGRREDHDTEHMLRVARGESDD